MTGRATPISSPPIERIGGKEGLRAPVERFQNLAESEPEAANLRGLHVRGLGG